MTAPVYHDLTPDLLERKLRALMVEGETLTADYTKQVEAAARAEATYRANYARYKLESELKLASDRDADAMARCANDGSLLQYKVSGAVAEATKQALRMNQANLSACQTMAKSLIIDDPYAETHS